MTAAGENGVPGGREPMERLAGLPVLSPEERLATIGELVRDPSPAVRGEAIRVGAVVLPNEAVVGFLREAADATLRNAGLEILKVRGGRGFPLAVKLLGDEDDDVVLQAVLVLDHLKDPRGLEPLRRLLDHPDPNVVQAALTAIGHLGDARVVDDLLRFVEADLWLQFAAIEALGDLRAAEAVEPLAGLLTDMIVGSQAAEALARIGGPAAWEALCHHWLALADELEPGPYLGFLAHVAEGLSERPAEPAALRPALAERLASHDEDARLAAARCLLVLGPGAEDALALDVLSAGVEGNAPLPTCIARRPDLVPRLLAGGGARRSHRRWGYLLAARRPAPVLLEYLVSGAEEVGDLEEATALAEALDRIGGPAATAAALHAWLALPVARRAPLGALLAARPGELSQLLTGLAKIPEESRLVLEALAGARPQALAGRIEALEPEVRLRVLSQVSEQKALVRVLPWARWLEEDPGLYAAAAAEAAVRADLQDLLPLLRRVLARFPSLELIRAVGELRDRRSVPLLVELYHGQGDHRPVLVESLGRIGGPEARAALRPVLEERDGALVRIAYRALSYCALEEDDEIFRTAVTHPDWYVRLACADVLGRFRGAENRAALAQLAADPVSIVSQRALASLEG